MSDQKEPSLSTMIREEKRGTDKGERKRRPRYLFDRNVDTVTDNVEYRNGMSAREVGWQSCPGVPFIGASLRIRIQVVTGFDRTTTRGASKRRAWEAKSQRTLPAHGVLDSVSESGGSFPVRHNSESV